MSNNIVSSPVQGRNNLTVFLIKGRNIIEQYHAVIIAAFFLGLLLLGFSIYQDYGINWDDPIQRSIGRLNWDYVTGRNTLLIGSKHSYYGPVFELFLYMGERFLKLEQLRAVYFFRHAMTFGSFYVGVIFFYLLCRKVFKSWKMGFLGIILLLLSPRIFENGFYNTKDIPFLSLYIICLYILIVLIEKPSYRLCIIYAIASSVMIDIRNAGIILPILSVFLFLTKYVMDYNRVSKKENAKKLWILCIYIVITYTLIILMWPSLWHDPLKGFFNSLIVMRKFPWLEEVLFFGSYIKAKNVPWYYIPAWIGITTPIIYSFFFISGSLLETISLFRKPFFLRNNEKINRFIIIFSIIGPVLAVIILKVTLYDSWRQMFFIYPSFLIIALIGIEKIHQLLITRITYRNSIIIIGTVVLASCLSTLSFMTHYHPHQGVYFNRLAGRDMQTIKQRFDLDFWGLSYFQAIKYIANNDISRHIPIYVTDLPGVYNTYMLVASEMDRFEIVNKIEDAKYFLSDYRWHPGEFDYPNEVFNIMIGNAKIMVVYKLK